MWSDEMNRDVCPPTTHHTHIHTELRGCGSAVCDDEGKSPVNNPCFSGWYPFEEKSGKLQVDDSWSYQLYQGLWSLQSRSTWALTVHCQLRYVLQSPWNGNEPCSTIKNINIMLRFFSFYICMWIQTQNIAFCIHHTICFNKRGN